MKKKLRLLWAIILVVAAVVGYFGIFYDYFNNTSGDMSLHILDVGQGDCLLLESGGEFGLIDAGNAENGEDIVAYLQELGVKKLKFAVATHPHADHIGGMAQVLAAFGTELFIMPDAQNPTKTFENMLDAVEQYADDAQLMYAGDRITLGQAEINVLSPEKGFSDDDMNNYSLVLQASAGGCRFLLTGDSEIPAEEKYAPFVSPIDVLKVGHHGSETSTGEQLLQAAKPEIAVISSGEGNTYGHPHDEIVTALENAGAEIYRTDKSGTLVFIAEGGAIYVKNK